MRMLVSGVLLSVLTAGAAVGKDFSSAVETAPRQGVGNFLAKIRAGRPVTVAYFGGSITEQGDNRTQKGGWRVKTTKWLRETYPNARVTEINAAIGGTGSDLGVYRYGKDVLAHDPDLVFVEFACNDGGDACSTNDVLRNFEGIVRQTWRKDPRTDIVFAYVITDSMCPRYLSGRRPRAAQMQEFVADRYGIPTVDFGPRVARLIAENKLLVDVKAVLPTAVPKGDPKFDQAVRDAMKNEKRILFANDGVHPRDEGHDIYMTSVRALFDAMKDLPAVDHAPTLARVCRPDNRERAKMVPVAATMTAGGSWQALDGKEPMQKHFARRLGQVWRGCAAGDSLKFRFKGTSCSVYDLLGPACGQVWVTVDGQRRAKPVPRFDGYCTYYRVSRLPVFEGADGVHEVEISIDANQPDRTPVAFRLKDPKTELAGPRYSGTNWYVGQIMVVGDVLQ